MVVIKDHIVHVKSKQRKLGHNKFLFIKICCPQKLGPAYIINSPKKTAWHLLPFLKIGSF